MNFWSLWIQTLSECRDDNNNNNRRLTQVCPLFACHFCPWTVASSPVQVLHSEESSDDCARGGDTSSSRSLRPWPRTSTTPPYGDRRRPGLGRRITRCTTRRRSGRILLPLAAGVQHFFLDDEEPPAAGSRLDRIAALSRPQERELRRTVEQIVDAVPLVPLLNDPVPQMVEQLQDVMRFFDTLQPVPEQVITVPKILLDDVPWCRTSTFQFQVVEGEFLVLKVFFPGRVQQRFMVPSSAFLSGLWRRTLISPSVEASKIFSQDIIFISSWCSWFFRGAC